MAKSRRQKNIGKPSAGAADAKFNRLAAKGRKYFKREDWANAAKYYLEAWDIKPEDKDILVIISHLLVQLGVREKAIMVLERALELHGPTKEILSIMGDMALNMAMHEIAEKLFRIYVEHFPQEAFGYNSLANALSGQDRHEESIAILQDVIPLFPESQDLWNTLAAHVALRDGPAASIVFYEEAYRLAPNDYRISNNLARVYEKLLNHEKAIEWGERAVALNPTDPEPRIGLGLTYLSLGKLPEGWMNYDYRHDPKRVKDVLHYTHKLPKYDGAELAGKSVLATSEQGVGDEILFGVALPRLYDEVEQLYIGCDYRLVSIFQRTFPNAVIAKAGSIIDHGYFYRGFLDIENRLRAGEIKIDYGIPMGSIAGHYWQSLEEVASFPDGYLKTDPGLVKKWAVRIAELGDKPKIGIAWRSGKVTADRGSNYLLIEELAPILEIEGVTFVNLQYGDCTEEVAEAKERFGVTLHEWDDLNLKDDFEDIFALMQNLDLVLSPGTAVAMMSMAVGTPVWWMLLGDPWYAFNTHSIPFFPKGDYFHTPADQPWTNVTNEVAERLKIGLETGTFTAR